MCTAISFNAKNHYFGRNLDLERRYKESVTITPRNYVFHYKSGEIERKHFAMIGVSMVLDDYPLYYDATNEHGLSIAGLNFVGNAYLGARVPEKINLAPYELIPYLLGKCKNVDECEEILKDINLVDVPFDKNIKNAELHWLISDENRSIVLECMKDGVKIHPNDVGVLTNNPPFEHQMMNLNNYINLSPKSPRNNFSDKIELNVYSRGMGALGMPGDLSSTSRFVRAAFVKLNSVIPKNELDCVSQIFHILGSVEQQEGSVSVGDKFERTQYTSCCDTSNGIYYYKTYENSQITAINMHNENLDDAFLVSYNMICSQQIRYAN